MAPSKKKRKTQRGRTGRKNPPKKEAKYPIGTSVRKWFEGHGWFNGQIISYDSEEGFYKVRYVDDDEEEYSESDLEGIIVVKGDSKSPDVATSSDDGSSAQPNEGRNPGGQYVCEFCRENFDINEHPDDQPPAEGCMGCGKMTCSECGSRLCCGGNCPTFYCIDCSQSLLFHCPCNPNWQLCEIHMDDPYSETPKQCSNPDCNKFVCTECENDKNETHWRKCSNCNNFTCKECSSGERCWCWKSWHCLDCSEEAVTCEVGCRAWMCGKGKCKGKMTRDEEVACPDCRRRS